MLWVIGIKKIIGVWRKNLSYRKENWLFDWYYDEKVKIVYKIVRDFLYFCVCFVFIIVIYIFKLVLVLVFMDWCVL